MESNDKLKEISIKNHTCYFFDDIIKNEDFGFDNILLDEKSHILFKTFIGSKPLHIRFNKVGEFIRVYDETKYLVFFGGENYDFSHSRVRYLTGVKSGIIYAFSQNYAKVKDDSYDFLRLEKNH